jgi:hypothetical protein
MAVEGLLGLAEHEFSSWDGSGEIIAGMMNAGTFPTNWNGFVPDDRYLRDLIKYGQNHELLDEVSDNLSTMNRVLFKRLLTRRYVLNFFSPRSWGDDVKFNLDAPTF